MKDGCIAAVDRTPEIPMLMNTLSDKVSHLRTSVDEIKKRIQPVSLREPPEESSGESAKQAVACATDFGHYLHGTISQLEHIISDLGDATERIQL